MDQAAGLHLMPVLSGVSGLLRAIPVEDSWQRTWALNCLGQKMTSAHTPLARISYMAPVSL